MGYDFERLGVACSTVLECVDAVLKHKPGHKFTWRLERLRREVFEFSSVAYPNGFPSGTAAQAAETIKS